jgi:predicted MFS family arabinose efflux permease
LKFLGEKDSAFNIRLFLVVSAFVGLAMGMSDSIIANYFKDAYDVNAQQRGFIELPRELPGVLAMFFIAAIASLRGIKSAICAQLLAGGGILVLALVRPEFQWMLVFLFIYSLGQHMFLTLGDSIALSLADSENRGRVMGSYNSVRMAFLMIAGIVTFLGFRSGLFSFETPVSVFILSAVCFLGAAILLAVMSQTSKSLDRVPKQRFVFRKEYARYYLICVLYGGRKQIMIVYSPWVLIDLLDFKADVISILAVIGSLVGVFFMPQVGRWIDHYGVKRVMMAESLCFIAVYITYGFLSKWVNTHAVVLTGLVMMFVYLLNIVDRMSAQFAMVRSIYMLSIALDPDDVTPSLSLGMSIDHVFAIGGAYLCGLIWFKFGPEYVFIIAGVLSFLNLLVASRIRLEK